MISLDVLEPGGNSHRIYATDLICWLLIIIRGRMFCVLTMDHVCVKESFKFIGFKVMVCFHGCDHIKNVVGYIVAFERFHTDLKWLFIGRFGVFSLICCGIILYSAIFELCVVVQYLCHLNQCQVHSLFHFVQDSPDFRLIAFRELPPLLPLFLPPLLPPLLLLFISW